LNKRFLGYLVPYVVRGGYLYSFTKDGVEQSSVPLFMESRYLIAGLALLALSRRVIVNRDTVLLSAFTFASTALWGYGLLYVKPSESAVLSYTMPLFAVPASAIILKEKPGPYELLGIALGFAGVAVYSSGIDVSPLGAVLTVANAVFWALFSVCYRKLRDYDPLVLNATQFLIGALFFLPLLPFGLRVVDASRFALGLAYSAVLGGLVQFLLWNLMLREEKVNRVVVFVFSVPIFTTFLDAVGGDLTLTPNSIAGIVMMFLGIAISQLGKRSPGLKETEPVTGRVKAS
jgi:drug/metabolite transporter (DMT)-like permease